MSTPPGMGYYDWLEFNSPMTSATADALVAELADLAPRQIVDIGCGWAEFVLRLLVACPGATAVGVDTDAALIDRARRNAGDRNVGGRIELVPTTAGVERSDLVVNCGAEHVFGSLADALPQLFDLVVPGGHLFLGTQYWQSSPPPDVEQAIGHLPTLSELIDLVVGCGFRPIGLTESSRRDWDHFEMAYLRDWEQVVIDTPATSAAEDARRSADRHRAAYLRRRGILGFVFLTLGRPAASPT